jgi:methyl-accepting chemotaxis protein
VNLIFDRLSLKASVMVFVVVALLSALALSGLALRQNQASEALSDRLLTDVQLARAAGNVDMMHDALRSSSLRARLTGPAAAENEKNELPAEATEQSRSMLASFAVLERQTEAELRAQVQALQPAVQRYTDTAVALVRAELQNTAAAQAMRARLDKDFEVLEEGLEALSTAIEKHAEADVQARDQLFSQARWILAGMLAATLLAMALVGLAFTSQLMRRLGAEPKVLSELAGRIAAGDLDAGLAGAQHTGSVAQAMLNMRDGLRGLVTVLGHSAEQLNQGSDDIASGNQDLSGRTDAQVRQLQQTATSIEQMTGSVAQSAEHARRASERAGRTRAVAAKGGEDVERVVRTMEDIDSSSRRITDIISTIDGIAFQTNILALNAAVEAARAGEQGRGFAVVAAEVRTLAQRSAAAAREIKQLIERSGASVAQGRDGVAAAGATMQQIVTEVHEVAVLIEEISEASQQQRAGIAEVNAAMAAIDQGTQHNAALVQQTASSAEALRSRARELTEAVGRFKLAAG